MAADQPQEGVIRLKYVIIARRDQADAVGLQQPAKLLSQSGGRGTRLSQFALALQQLFLGIERVLDVGQRADPLDNLAGFVAHGYAAGLKGSPCPVPGAPDTPLRSIDRAARPHGTHPIGRHLRPVIRVNGRNPLRVFIFVPGLAGVLLPARLTLHKFAFRARDPDDRGGSEKNGVVTGIAAPQLLKLIKFLKLIKVLSAHQGSFCLSSNSPHLSGNRGTSFNVASARRWLDSHRPDRILASAFGGHIWQLTPIRRATLLPLSNLGYRTPQ